MAVSDIHRFREHLAGRGKPTYYSDRVLQSALGVARRQQQQDRRQQWIASHRPQPTQHVIEQDRFVYAADLGECPPGHAGCSVQLVAEIAKDYHLAHPGESIPEKTLCYALEDEGATGPLVAIFEAVEARVLQKAVAKDGTASYHLMP
jgi:hypothetical protein